MTRVADLLPETSAKLLPEGVADRRVNWLEVARKDVADAARSWQLIALCGLFVGLLQFLTTVRFLTGDGISFATGRFLLGGYISLLVPLTALVVGYRAVVGEQETGSLRVLLGLPITRRDVLIGKFLGRSVLLGVVLLGGLALAGAALWYTAGDFDLATFLLFVGLSLVYGLVFVVIGVGISAVARSRARSMAAVMGIFMLVYFVWRAIPDALFYLKYGRFVKRGSEADAPLIVFIGNANPVRIHQAAIRWLDGAWGDVWRYQYLSLHGTIPTRADPFYLDLPFLFVVLVLWGVVPLVVGAWWFGRRDLG